MKKKDCLERLSDLINDVVLIDVEEQIDTVFEKITKDKNGKESYNAELEELHELRNEFKAILEDIEAGDMEADECKELYDEILIMISQEEE